MKDTDIVFQESVEFRYYVMPDRKERFELYSKAIPSEKINLSVTQELGQSLVDLYETDLSFAHGVVSEILSAFRTFKTDKKDIAGWEKIKNLATQLLDAHPFCWFFYKSLCDLEWLSDRARNERAYVDSSSDYKIRTAVRSFGDTIKDIAPDARFLVERCLNDRYKPNCTTAERYRDSYFRNGDRPDRLLYGDLVTEEVFQDRPDTDGTLCYSVEQLREQSITATFREVLYPNSLSDLYNYIKAYCLRLPLPVHKCKNCGRYFPVTGNITQDYCNRTIEGSDKTCRQMGAVLQYQQRQMQHPAKKEFSRSYKAHNARVRYGTLSKEDFTAWSKVAREKRDACVAGELSLEDFVAWLDRDKQR